MSKIVVWLMRHGQSTANIGEVTNDVKMIGLTKLGKQQVIQAANQINVSPNLIITSPWLRAIESALPICDQWPKVTITKWPIQELVYLSPNNYHLLSIEERKRAVEQYWKLSDPFYCDGEDAESFADFIQRVKSFHDNILDQDGFTIAVGHGQFFKAYLLGLNHGWAATPEWMTLFRTKESKQPLLNGEIVKFVLNK